MTTTTTNIAVLHRSALDATRQYVMGVGADQWEQPTPCDGWNVRDLVNHIVAGNLWAAELARGRSITDVGSALDGDVVGTNPTGAYDKSAQAAAAAFEASGVLEAPCAVSYGPVPGTIYAGHRFIDVLIHGWDLATATGQTTTLDPRLVEACWEVIQPQLSMLQASGEFGLELPGRTDDNAQARLLAALGRQG